MKWVGTEKWVVPTDQERRGRQSPQGGEVVRRAPAGREERQWRLTPRVLLELRAWLLAGGSCADPAPGATPVTARNRRGRTRGGSVEVVTERTVDTPSRPRRSSC